MGKKSKSFEESEERLTKAVRDSAQEICQTRPRSVRKLDAFSANSRR